MSRHQDSHTGRGITWTLLCLLMFGGSLLLAAPNAEARKPPRKPSTDPVLRFLAVDNEGPIARMPIAFARRSPHQRQAVAPEAELERSQISAVVGPSKPTRKSPQPKPLMGPFPRR